MAETFSRVAGPVTERIGPEAVGRFQEAIAARAERIKAEIDRDEAIRRFREDFAALRERVEGWKLRRKRFGALRHGLEQTYRRARNDRRLVAGGASDEAIHDWRKQVKAHFYHLCLLRDIAPHVLGGQRDGANALGERLGEHHDISVFLATLAGGEDGFGTMDGSIAVREEMEAHKEALTKEALRLGNELLSEKPGDFVRRVERLWRAWRESGGS